MQASVMKCFITYLFCLQPYNLVFAGMEFSILHNETVHNKLRFIEFPDDDGLVHLIDVAQTSNINSGIQFDMVNQYTNQYFLYTRKNRWAYNTLKVNDANSITSSYFNASNPTVVIVHGWTGSRDSDFNVALRTAFITKADYNVIVLDWSRLAKKNYITAVAGVPRVGQYLGQFISFISSVTGVSVSSVHLVGHSLGSHVVGNAGRELKGRVGRITGLDPAGPLWNFNTEHLSKNDAIYVEAIHTNSGVFGIISSIAVADFYPNGGTTQPGCVTDFCNHKRSWELFVASLTFNNLVGRKCSTILQFSVDFCNGQSLKLGSDELFKSGSGVYRLKTNAAYPY